MIVSPEVNADIQQSVQTLRSLTGDKGIDLLWNKEIKRWVVCHRVPEAKFPVDGLLVGCLPNPDNPPHLTDTRALFKFESDRGGYLYPPGKERLIAEVFRLWAPRWSEADNILRENKAKVAREKAEWNKEFREDLEKDLLDYAAFGKRHITPGVSPGPSLRGG